MKQHITRKQLNELSEKGREKLRDWWIPQTGDTAMSEKTGNWNLVGGYQLNKTIAKKHFYPLLSIGQMIEFLDKSEEGDWRDACEGSAEKLCDNLWKDVKEVLEK